MTCMGNPVFESFKYPVSRLAAVRIAILLAVMFSFGMAAASAEDDTATFEVTVHISWSAETAPYEFPTDGHMSGIIGATHNHRYVLFRDGYTASSGLELVAENGRVATLRAEFAEAKRRKRIGTEIDGPQIKKVPGSGTMTVKTTKRHPLLSLITMIAPSPDWFTGVADFPLHRDGKWIDSAELTLWAWDSGTDNGTTYQAEDDDAQPQQSVRLLATPHFLTPQGVVSMGSVTIKRVSDN